MDWLSNDRFTLVHTYLLLSTTHHRLASKFAVSKDKKKLVHAENIQVTKIVTHLTRDSGIDQKIKNASQALIRTLINCIDTHLLIV